MSNKNNTAVTMWCLAQVQEKAGLTNATIRSTNHLKGLLTRIETVEGAADYISDLQISISAQITALTDLHKRLEDAKVNLVDKDELTS